MSILKAISLNKFWSCTIFTLTLIVVQNNCGIPLISAHCSNVGAKKPFQFHRNSSRTFHLVPDQPYETIVTKGQDVRFMIRLDEVAPLTIKFLSGQSNDTQLYFNETVNLSKYFATDTSKVTIPCAPIGQYDILLRTRGSDKCVKLQYSLTQPNQQAFSHYVQSSRIRYEKRSQKRQVMLQWEKSKLDIHAMKYCIAINTEGSKNTLCDALATIVGAEAYGRLFCSQLKTSDRVIRIDPRMSAGIACTGHRNKQIVQGLLPNRKYTVDLFGVHAKIGGMTFKLGSTTVLLNHSAPIELIDGRSELGKLTRFDRKAVFIFKNIKDRAPVQFLVIPCGYVMTVKIFNQKKLISRTEVDQPMLLRFNSTIQNDRFLMKIFPSNPDDIMQNAVNFKVIATAKDKFQSMPILPNRTVVEEIKSRRTCTEATIIWQSAPDQRNIKYCVSVIELKSRNFEDSASAFTINTCDLSKSQLKLFSSIEKCFVPTTKLSNAMERYTVTGLQPGHNYIVQVMLHRDHQSLPYQTVNIRKSHSHHCFASISTAFQLPKTHKSAKRLREKNNQKTEYQQIQLFEDNNVIVP